jgi:CDP-diacylglycerol--serine O-phosphatidyltransferase
VTAAPPPARVAWWRYAIPNAVTSASVVVAALSTQAAISGRTVEAAWLALIVLLTDRLDGFLAGRLGATSAFGVQLDSLADLASFGVAPAAIVYGFFSTRPQLGWSDGWPLVALRAVCALHLLGCALRLARYNVRADAAVRAGEPPSRHYLGITTTMTAGILLSLFLAVLKYADPAWTAPEELDRWRLFGGLRTDAILGWFPLLLPVGVVGMLSSIRLPKLGRTFSRVTDVLLILCVVTIYALGLARRLPECLVIGGLYYLGIAVAYHLRTMRRSAN